MFIALIGPARLHAESFVPKDFAELVQEAEHIFVGSIRRADARHVGGLIVTDFTFRVHDVVKGPPETEVTLTFVGGTIGDETLEVAGWPRLLPGQTYVVFARGNGGDAFPVVGGPQGLFRLAVEPGADQPIVRGPRGRPIDNPSVTAAVGPAPRLGDLIRAIALELGAPRRRTAP